MVGERPQHQAWQCSEASYRVSLMLMDKIVWGNSSKLKAGVIASSALYECAFTISLSPKVKFRQDRTHARGNLSVIENTSHIYQSNAA